MTKLVPKTECRRHLRTHPAALNLAVRRREATENRGSPVWAAAGRPGFDEGVGPDFDRIAGDVRHTRGAGLSVALDGASACIRIPRASDRIKFDRLDCHSIEAAAYKDRLNLGEQDVHLIGPAE